MGPRVQLHFGAITPSLHGPVQGKGASTLAIFTKCTRRMFHPLQAPTSHPRIFNPNSVAVIKCSLATKGNKMLVHLGFRLGGLPLDVFLEVLDPPFPFPVPLASASLCPIAIFAIVTIVGVTLLEICFRQFFELGFDVR